MKKVREKIHYKVGLLYSEASFITGSESDSMTKWDKISSIFSKWNTTLSNEIHDKSLCWKNLN